jgi:hypothetical protein
MPDQSPSQMFPFAVNALITVVQIFWMIKGQNVFYTARLVPSFLITALVMVLLPFIALLPQPINFWLTVVLLIIFGAVSGTIQASVFSMGGILPFEYMSSIIIGMAVCGLFCNGLRGLTLVLFPVTPEEMGTIVQEYQSLYSTVVFFSISAILLIVCAFV